MTSSAEATTHQSPELEEEAMNSSEQVGQELREAVAKALGVDPESLRPR